MSSESHYALFQRAFPDSKLVAALPESPYVHPEPPTGLARRRLQVRADVRSCAACGLADGRVHACPATYPSRAYDTSHIDEETPNYRPPLFTVIGEAPGKDEDRAGQPFVGPSGRLLREMFTTVGLFSQAVTYMNVVACFPWTGEKAKKPRRPTRGEVEACSGLFERQLEASGSPFVLLVGAEATSYWRQDVTVGEVRGNVYLWRGKYVVMPVYHPAYILRSGSRLERHRLAKDLFKWRQVVTGEVNWTIEIGIECVRCGDRADEWDEDAVGWCPVHWERGKLTRKKRLQKKVAEGQTELEGL